jgi:two-component sensor histidine kinase
MVDNNRLPLERVITTDELSRRASRCPNYELESRTLAELMTAMADQPNPDSLLQKLVSTARELCRAQSAGISILEKDASGNDVFRWRAVAGSWSIYRGESMPRESPCGTALDRNTALLMTCPERHYTCAQNVTPPVAEALLVPLRVCGNPVGTIWIIRHDETHQFDAEDHRLMMSLGRFAENAHQLLSRERLAHELAATKQLQEISSELLGERQAEGLYEKIIDAAAAIMHSDFASIQSYHARAGSGGELWLLANRGFTHEAATFWRRVKAKSKTTCGIVLESARRAIVPDIEESTSLFGDDLEMFRKTGIRAMQSTPLTSRRGAFLGVISTHWRRPHRPQEQELQYLDILARQAADLIERSLAEQHTRVLLKEVSHRAKNILAVIQGIVRQTAERRDPRNFARDLSERIAGLARSHELLVAGDWRGVELSEVVKSQMVHLRDLGDSRITFEGPSLRISPHAAQVVGIAMHELATNALKFGSLSNKNGLVVVRWEISEHSEPHFIMTWREHGGASVSPPEWKGFGHTAMVRMIEHALDADVALDYDPDGVVWRMDAPLAAVLQENN